MKRFFFLLFLVFCSCGILSADEQAKWNIEKSTHFVVYYKTASKDFVDTLINYSENYYNKIADDLGFRRFDFWLWEKRAKIYIYDDGEDFHKGTGFPVWVAGIASTKDKVIYTYPYAKGFFETVLPHEMGHLVFREFVGVNNALVPVWLDEGVASFQERGRVEVSERIVKNAIKSSSFIPLDKLTTMDPRRISDHNTVNLFYAEAVSLVQYLINSYGRDNFISFCQRLRDGKNLETALRSSYNFDNLGAFNEAWRKYLIDGS